MKEGIKEGMVCYLPLPQADGQTKNRPVLVLRRMPGFGDFLVCGISTQLRQEAKGLDLILDEKHPDFQNSGLKSASLIRLGFLAVIPQNKIPGNIGEVSTGTLKILRNRLAQFIIGN